MKDFKLPTRGGSGAKGRKKTQKRQPDPRVQDLRDRCVRRLHAAREWTRINARRWICIFHDAASDHQAMNPLTFLGVSAVLGVTLTLGTLYSTSYAVTVDGDSIGVVADQSVVTEAIDAVEQEGREILGYDYQVDGEVDYQFTLELRSNLSEEQDIETYFYDQLSQVSDKLRKYQLMLDGAPIGVVEDQNGLWEMLEEMKAEYTNENTVSYDFVEQVAVEYVYDATEVLTLDEMEQRLRSNKTGDTTYTVDKGDTFNGIAYRNNMSVSDLKALNPKVNINRLQIGDVLNVKEQIPALSVQTLDHERYTEPIPCPVETREDPNIYKGDSKIVKKGEEGVAQIEADVTYVNGIEKDRKILSNETVKEPTTTIKAIGTKPRPKTASHGNFQWPIRGKITSYFGSRYIFGRRSFHSGIDIKANYGAPIKAADGGKVTFAGYKGSYGNLVIITHDNGTQTYYAHNSSLLVSAGQRVYQGQTIAKAGSTGRSTGNHCHFEVRVNGTAVNPLNYLP